MSSGQDTEQAIQAHSAHFYLKFNSNLAKKDHTVYPMSDEILMKITNFMIRIKDGSTVSKLKNDHPQGYIYIDTFDVINLVAGGKLILVYRQKPDESAALGSKNTKHSAGHSALSAEHSAGLSALIRELGSQCWANSTSGLSALSRELGSQH